MKLLTSREIQNGDTIESKPECYSNVVRTAAAIVNGTLPNLHARALQKTLSEESGGRGVSMEKESVGERNGGRERMWERERAGKAYHKRINIQL